MTSAERSRVMRAVKGKDTAPERTVRHLLYKSGYRYRLHRKDLPGKPDLSFAGRRKVIFIHGCFWHGHECKRGNREPKSNVSYWRPKIARNRERDRTHQLALEQKGWSTLILWECELCNTDELLAKLTAFLGPPSVAGSRVLRN